jgi:hypothetical protein
MTDFAEFGPQNSATVPVGIGGVMWHPQRRVHKDEATSCGARDRKIENSMNWSICPSGMDTLYVNNGSLKNGNNPL